MSAVLNLALRVMGAFGCISVSRRDQLGQSTAEYGVVILVAIALGAAVLMLFTGGAFDGPLTSLLNTVLSAAQSMIPGN